jgi:predicted transcriptional regulator of viral defense system
MSTQEKLSRQQATILLSLFAHMEKLEKRPDAAAQTLLSQGIVWKVKVANSCRRASICRTLARLEKRGLLARVAPNGRATRVKLTEQGKTIALQLREAKTNY